MQWESRLQIILRLRPHETVLVKDCELVHGDLPVARRSLPAGGDVAKSQPDQLSSGIIRREVTARFDDLSQPRIHTLDAVRGVNLWSAIIRSRQRGLQRVLVMQAPQHRLNAYEQNLQ